MRIHSQPGPRPVFSYRSSSSPAATIRLFLAMTKITADAAEHFCLPGEQTVIMKSRIEL